MSWVGIGGGTASQGVVAQPQLLFRFPNGRPERLEDDDGTMYASFDGWRAVSP